MSALEVLDKASPSAGLSAERAESLSDRPSFKPLAADEINLEAALAAAGANIGTT
jgi:hypothetical protein